MGAEELIRWAERELGIYLDVNAAESALLGQLARFGTVVA